MIKNILVFILIAFSLQFVCAQSALIKIEKGEFVMGCTSEQKPDCDGDEYPIHAVSLSTYYIGKFEVRQSEWQNIMGDNPSIHQDCGIYCPVENIDFYSMLVYCNELTLNDDDLGEDELFYYKDESLETPWTLADYKGNGDTGQDEVHMALDKKGYRLPFEAEWEYAARGAQLAEGYQYAGSNNPDEVAWYNDNSEDATHPIGMKKANELGIFDLSGNVWEKVYDTYEDFEHEHQCDPTGPVEGTNRVNRGGAYRYPGEDCHISSRFFNKASRTSGSIGFRIARYE